MVEISLAQMVFSWPFNNYDTAKTRILNLPPLSPFVTNFLPPPRPRCHRFFFLHHQTHYVKYKNDPQGWKLWYFLEKIPLTWNNNNFCPAFGIKWGIPVFHLWLSPLVNPPPPVTVGESPSPPLSAFVTFFIPLPSSSCRWHNCWMAHRLTPAGGCTYHEFDDI